MLTKEKKEVKKNYSREYELFRKYAKEAKSHFGKYKSKRVVMLRMDLIGDCTMFTSAAAAIRNIYKDCAMDIICLSSARQIFERLGIFDRIFCIDFKPHIIDYDKLDKFIGQIRSEEYDILLQPQLSKYPVADIIAAAVRCNKRIAIQPKPGNSSAAWIKVTNFLYDRFIPYSEDIVSEFDYYGTFVRGLGFPDYKITRPCLPYNDQSFIEGLYYVLYPGGSLSQKFWPSERFAKIADHIYRRTGLTGVILGVKDEQWVSDRLIANLDPRTAMAMIDLTGKTSMSDVIDIIGNAELVVSNDTSGVHIACATNTPSVANVGGWLFGRFLPYHIEDIRPGDHLPLVAHADMPCFYCEWDWKNIEPQNPGCLEKLKEGRPSECIYNISYDQMEELVDKAIEDNNLC